MEPVNRSRRQEIPHSDREKRRMTSGGVRKFSACTSAAEETGGKVAKLCARRSENMGKIAKQIGALNVEKKKKKILFDDSRSSVDWWSSNLFLLFSFSRIAFYFQRRYQYASVYLWLRLRCSLMFKIREKTVSFSNISSVLYGQVQWIMRPTFLTNKDEFVVGDS